MRALLVYLQKFPSLKYQMHELMFIYDMGFKKLMSVFIEMWQDRWFDQKYGTDTQPMVKLSKLNIGSKKKQSGYNYQASNIRPFQELMKKVQFPKNGTFVDFGCGKGRTLLLASGSDFAEVKGVEFSEELCHIATENINKFAGKTAIHCPVHVIHSDADEYKITKSDNIFYFFNPFNEDILSSVVDNIEKSIQKHPRTVYIIYAHPLHKICIEGNSAYQKIFEENLGGFDVIVYRRDAD